MMSLLLGRRVSMMIFGTGYLMMGPVVLSFLRMEFERIVVGVGEGALCC